jgi:uncharacterized protein with PIN domain
LRFIIDQNVGKLAKWLRMLGYDSLFFTGEDDSQMVRQALAENRILLTRDTGIMKRRVATTGRLKAILMQSEEPEKQMRQLVVAIDLNSQAHPFTICLECNRPLIDRKPEEVKDRVPPYVYKTQTQYMECPECRRIYWRGTHWKAMLNKLHRIVGIVDSSKDQKGAL